MFVSTTVLSWRSCLISSNPSLIAILFNDTNICCRLSSLIFEIYFWNTWKLNGWRLSSFTNCSQIRESLWHIPTPVIQPLHLFIDRCTNNLLYTGHILTAKFTLKQPRSTSASAILINSGCRSNTVSNSPNSGFLAQSGFSNFKRSGSNKFIFIPSQITIIMPQYTDCQ